MGLNVKAICWRQHFKYLNQSAPSSSVKKINVFGNLITAVAKLNFFKYFTNDKAPSRMTEPVY